MITLDGWWVSAQLVPQLYEINRATQAEMNRIRSDPTLTDDEKIEALADAQTEREKAVAQLVGPEAFKRWLQAQTVR